MRKKYLNWAVIICSCLGTKAFAKEVVVPVLKKPRASHVLTIDENTRVEAKIAKDVMNRIAVVNDRIVNIFGEEETFTVQTDEHTGQIFIKPTIDNADQPIALTIITENGLTQDLTLMPTQTKAATIILKQAASKSASPLTDTFSGITRNKEDQWIQVIKQAVLGELSVSTITTKLEARKVPKLQVTFNKCYHSGNWQVLVWRIKNSSQDQQILEEKLFFKPGDVALSLASTVLEPNEQTLLYVLRTDHD